MIAGLVDAFLQQTAVDVVFRYKGGGVFGMRGRNLLCIGKRLANDVTDVCFTHAAAHALNGCCCLEHMSSFLSDCIELYESNIYYSI